MPLIERFKYRPEIDGLRAIAVILVVLYHADIRCRGGYIGVDVFFVISGFLITSLIWKDLESGKFSFANFWERRARRIIPALVVVTLATLVAGCFILFPGDLVKAGRASAIQTVFAANIHYFLDSGYFMGDSNEKPLLHTWSLAVEEQFYLIVPFLMFGLFRFPKLRSRKVVLGLIMGALAISLALSIRELPRDPSAAFYLIHSRAWELLMGSFIAFLPLPGVGGKSKAIFETCSISGLLLILLPAFIWYTRKTPFPGLAAVPPCLGAALYIWANGSMTTFAGRLLSRRPVVFVGLISYSLYLWHWPFMAYYNYLLLDKGHRYERIGLVILGFACAVLSWKYVETPFRLRKLGTTRKSMFAYAGAGCLAVLALGLAFVALNGLPQRFSPKALEYAKYANDLSFANEVSVADAESGKLVPIGSSNPNVKPTVLIWGDSHAIAAIPALDQYLKNKNLAGWAATHSATAPVVEWFRPSEVGLGADSPEFTEAILRLVEKQRISDVVLAACWRIYRSKGKGSDLSFESSLLETVRRVAQTGARPWVLLDVPQQGFDVPRALSRFPENPARLNEFLAKPQRKDELADGDPDLIEKIKQAGGFVIDPKPYFLNPEGTRYIVESKGVPLYRDGNHLGTQGSKLMLMPVFQDAGVGESEDRTSH